MFSIKSCCYRWSSRKEKVRNARFGKGKRQPTRKGFSNFNEHQNHLEDLLKHRELSPTPRVSEPDLGRSLRIFILTSFWMMLKLLTWGHTREPSVYATWPHREAVFSEHTFIKCLLGVWPCSLLQCLCLRVLEPPFSPRQKSTGLLRHHPCSLHPGFT